MLWSSCWIDFNPRRPWCSLPSAINAAMKALAAGRQNQSPASSSDCACCTACHDKSHLCQLISKNLILRPLTAMLRRADNCLRENIYKKCKCQDTCITQLEHKAILLHNPKLQQSKWGMYAGPLMECTNIAVVKKRRGSF